MSNNKKKIRWAPHVLEKKKKKNGNVFLGGGWGHFVLARERQQNIP